VQPGNEADPTALPGSRNLYCTRTPHPARNAPRNSIVSWFVPCYCAAARGSYAATGEITCSHVGTVGPSKITTHNYKHQGQAQAAAQRNEEAKEEEEEESGNEDGELEKEDWWVGAQRKSSVPVPWHQEWNDDCEFCNQGALFGSNVYLECCYSCQLVAHTECIARCCAAYRYEAQDSDRSNDDGDEPWWLCDKCWGDWKEGEEEKADADAGS
jgi:hypothetical protein